MDSSIRSRQTGQVGSSTSDGVGGGAGLLRVLEAAVTDEEDLVLDTA